MCGKKILWLRIFSVACFGALMLVSCKKFVTVPPPSDFLTGEVIFNDDAMATGAVIGIYNEMMSINSNFSASGMTIYGGMCADELSHFSTTGSAAITRSEFINNEITTASHTTPISTQFWDKAYKFIYSANACIEGLDRSTGVSAAVKDKLKGECYFIRAFCHLNLFNLFGRVPLATTSDYRVTSVLPRADSAAIFLQLTEDLQKAEQLLPSAYDSIGTVRGRIRPNKWAATSLLARIYLYRKDWVNAEAKAAAVIGSGIYTLPENTANVFLANSAEAIWQLLPVLPSNSTSEGSLLLPNTTGSPGYIVTNSLLDAFEPNDSRKSNWLGIRNAGNPAVPYYYPAKYKIKTAAVVTEYYMVLRLAEQYLIRAEARNNQNNLSGAIEDINMIRHRAGLDNITGMTQEELITAIAQERRIELFLEWGHRWNDLRRTGRDYPVLHGLKPSYATTDALWPIPSDQIRLNSALTQNPSY